MQEVMIQSFVRPMVEDVVRLVLGKIPQNGSLDLGAFLELCAHKCPAVLELKPEGCEAEGCQYQLAVSIVASTVAFALFFGAANPKELTDRDRELAKRFRELIPKKRGGTEVIARVAFRNDEAAWALAKKPR